MKNNLKTCNPVSSPVSTGNFGNYSTKSAKWQLPSTNLSYMYVSRSPGCRWRVVRSRNSTRWSERKPLELTHISASKCEILVWDIREVEVSSMQGVLLPEIVNTAIPQRILDGLLLWSAEACTHVETCNAEINPLFKSLKIFSCKHIKLLLVSFGSPAFSLPTFVMQ